VLKVASTGNVVFSLVGRRGGTCPHEAFLLSLPALGRNFNVTGF
jgi:hypothetical protein